MTRHAGAPEATRKHAAVAGWACERHEGTPDRRSKRTDDAAWATGCHYCRIMRVAQAINGNLPDEMEVSGVLAETLGVEEGAKVAPLVLLRAACVIADDTDLIAVIDRIHPTTEPGEDHA